MIASGTYGCVYKPALKCKGSDERGDGVTKLMKREDAETEIKEQERVDKIDPEFKYHLKTPTICEVGEYDIENDKNLEECILVPIARDADDRWKEDFVLMQMEDGGKSIYDIINKRVPKIFRQRLSWKMNFISGMKNLFEGLKDFEKANFVHFDIKSANIVYKEETNRFNYIDFGLSTKRDDIRDKFSFMLTAGYYALPFDIILTKNSNYRLLKDTEKESLNEPRFKKYLNRIFERTYKSGYMPFFEKHYIKGDSIYKQTYEDPKIIEAIHNEMNTRSRENVINEMYSKLDVFSLGIILIELYYALSGNKYDINGPDVWVDPFFKDIHRLIKNMTHPFFKERYSASEACNHFNELLIKFNIGDISPTTKSISISKEKQKLKSSPKTKKKSKRRITRKKLIEVDSFTSSKKGTYKRHSSTRIKNGEVKVRNPKTGRWIKKTGKLAKKLGLDK